MTARQRFAATMSLGCPDRVPLFEEGLREDVLARWREQGLGEAELADLFCYDRREQVPVDLEPRPRLERPVASRRDLAALRERLDPLDPARLPDDWARRVAAWRGRDHVLQLPIHRGLFLSLGVGDWSSFVRVACQVRDDPGLVAEAMAAYGRFAARLAERVLGEVGVDFASFSEPIGGNDRPLVSPRDYRRLALSSYRPVLEALRRGGVRTVVFLTYANARALLPAVLDAGFDCLWACETEGAAMDYRSLRRELGPALRLIGGIDLDVLLTTPERIRRELEAEVPPLLAQGGYVPLADGRVRANVPFAHYACYRSLLERLVGAR
ncbi:MAG: uroporphyrinogen decarboxylase family protein [Candidatus Brocadiia bacterium]